MKTEEFFDHLWRDYVAMAPRAARLKQVFEERGDRVVNDHVAFRTLDLDPIRISALEPHLLELGYMPLAPYEFTAKKLSAWAYVHPDPETPKVFVSALDVSAFSERVQEILRNLCGEINPDRVSRPDVFWAGKLWPSPAWDDYQALLAESEYAAWVAAIGLRPNHFTIFVNCLDSCESVEDVLQVVEAQGMGVNASGGRVKGGPDVLLEQGSTLADRMPVEFDGGDRHEIPTCYYEFARRFPDETGEIYSGFVAASADKIFESTDVKKSAGS